jgi:C4-type Zn-finger protein
MPEQWTHHGDAEYERKCPACGADWLKLAYIPWNGRGHWRWERIECTCQKCGYKWQAVPLHTAKRLQDEQARRAARRAGGQNA